MPLVIHSILLSTDVESVRTMISKRLRLERLERRDLLASDWTNPLNPLDVNVSGEVTPLDVLLIVNDINRSEIGRASCRERVCLAV